MTRHPVKQRSIRTHATPAARNGPLKRVKRTSSDLYQMLFKHAENGILVYDDKGRFVEANRVACQWLGYQRRELLKRSLADILVQDEQTGDLL